VYEQLYVLLVASTKDGVVGEPLYNPRGLSTSECFDFLIGLSLEYRTKILSIFSGNYDINMMLKNVPQKLLQELWERRNSDPDRYPTLYRAKGKPYTYAMSYRPGKSLLLRLVFNDKKWIEGVKFDENGEASEDWGINYIRDASGRHLLVYTQLWDVYEFFQCSFVDALGSKEKGYFTHLLHTEMIDGKAHEIIEWPDGLRIDLTKMKSMKRNRRSFTLEQLEQEILPYCRDETTALARLMETLSEHLNEANISISDWNGPGACAGALLRREHVKEHMKEYMPDKSIYDVQLRAYSAGRMESGKFGVYIGKVWCHDVHSAFPSMMPELPNLDGLWRYVCKVYNDKTYPDRALPYSLMHVEWSFDPKLPYHPFFYRELNRGIYFPHTGNGWYWKPEVDAALRAYKSGKLSTSDWSDEEEFLITEAWEFSPYSDVKPFAFMPSLYQLRRQWKRLGKAAEKVLKFTINSVYGKLIQSKGGTKEKKPSYHNVGWAGYITSSIRARLFDAIMQNPESVIMLTIDGIWSTAPLDLSLGGEMGQWEKKEYDGIIAVQYGIYWALTKLGREPTEEERSEESFHEKYLHYEGVWYEVEPHYRGFDKGSLTPDMVIKAWKNLDKKIKVPATRFMTLASAMTNQGHQENWLTWRTILRSLDLEPSGKRVSKLSLREAQPYNNLVDTFATVPGGVMIGELSQKYRLKWEDEEEFGKVDGVPEDIFLEEHVGSEV